MRKNSIENYKSMFGDFWFETPVYKFNFENSLRFELFNKFPSEEYKVLKFLNELFNDLFLDDVYLILPFGKGITYEKLSMYGVEVKRDFEISFGYYTRILEINKDAESYTDTSFKETCKVFKLRYKDYFMLNLFCWRFKCGSYDIPEFIIADSVKKVFLNIDNHRCCDVVIKYKEFMKEIYEKYSEWILECNRDEIIKKIYG